MKIALVCPASFPATQFGGIVFLATDLDFSNGANKFNKQLPRTEKFGKFTINRTHVWFSLKLFFVNTTMSKEIEKDKPDIIHTIGLRSYQSIIAWRVSKKLGIPLVVSDQGGLTTHPFLNESSLLLKILYKIQKIVIKKIINHAAAISAANEYERDIFLEFKKNSKIEIIRNGINLKTLVSKENFRNKYKINNKFILFVGRFSISKGIKTLIQAFDLVQNKFPGISLIIMGVDFGYEKDMEKLIHTLNLSKKIIIIKNPPREDVISAYGESEFLVLPSQWELSPLVPLESFAFKKPVISTKSHGIPFTVKDNENGILVEPEKPEQLSEAITKLLVDDKLRNKLGLSGYNFVHEKCNSVSMAKHSLKLYNELLKNNDNK